jgi:uncharacterized delta-60 repeat protein
VDKPAVASYMAKEIMKKFTSPGLQDFLGRFGCLTLALLFLCGLTVNNGWAQATIPSGTFQFTTSSYSVSPNEGFSPLDPGASMAPSLLGARLTVTRSNGSSGRVDVPVVLVNVTNYFKVSTFVTTNGSFTTTVNITTNILGTNSPVSAGTQTNYLVFDDYQMSASILLSPSQYGSTTTPSQILTNFDGTGTNVIGTVLTNTVVASAQNLAQPMLDPLESSDLQPPTLPPSGNLTEQVSVLSPIGVSSNSVLNIERATFRIDKDKYQNAVIYVTRSGGARDQAVTVNYLINPVAGTYAIQSGFAGNPQPGNTYALESGSDYAVAGSDFTPVSGTLSWGAYDSIPKAITIPIMNDGNVDFNKDLQLALWIPSGSTQPATVGPVSTATVTILSDSYMAGQQSAGSVDRTWNKDNSDGFDSSPPYLQYPGTKGGVSDTVNGNGGTVYAAVEQPDGKAIIAGSFNSFDSNPYNRIVRLLANGYQDPTFLVAPNSGANDVISAMALQPNGQIVIGGNFTAFNGANLQHVARLNSDGSVDSSFNPGQGADGPVWAMALQPDGKIVIGGGFTHYNGTGCSYIARLNVDGSLDTGFAPSNSVDGPVYALAVMVSTNATVTNIYIGGAFDAVGGVNAGGVARLNQDGSLDTTFSVGIGAYNPDFDYYDQVYALAVQGSQLLVGGSFSFMELANYNGLVRLNPDGTIDTTFNPGSDGSNGTYNPQTRLVDSIYAITLQPDGNILIGGDFTTFNQTRRVGIARLFSYGSVDTSFMDTAYNQFAGLVNHYHNPDAVNLNDYPQGNNRNFVSAIVVEPTTPNNVIIGGSFLRVGGGSVFHSGTYMSGAYYPIYPDNGGIATTTNSGIFANGRMDIHPRSNVARLIGGATPGPGNISLTQGGYSADKSAGSTYISIVRTNGSLGIISASCSPAYQTPGPGIATTNDVAGGATPTWPTLYSLSPNRSWTVSPGTFGPNYIYDSTYAGGNPNQPPDVFLTILNNTNITGNVNAQVDLFAPVGNSFSLGGEVIPLGAALGFNNLSPLLIIDTNIKPGIFGFSSSAYTVIQGSTATITVTRTNGIDSTVQINYATINGTATSPANYTAVNGTLTFGPGVSSKTFTVPTVSGTGAQPDKTVNLQLSSVTGGATISQASAILTIVNSSITSGHLAFTTPTFTVNENAGTALVTINRLGGSTGTLNVTAIVAGGTAVNGVNYVASTNLFQWNNGDLSVKTISVPIIHDGVYTTNLTVNLQLTKGLLNTLPNANVLGLSAITNAVLTIVNVDFPGTVQFAAGAYSVKKYAGSVQIPVVRTGGSAQTVTVSYATSNGTATSGVNYSSTSGTLTFTNGQVAQFIQVPIIDDGQIDGPLMFNLQLSSANPAMAQGSPSNAVVTIIDTASINEPPGSIDTTFSPFAGCNGNVYALALQANNQLLVGGNFTMADGVPRQNLARLNADGSLDAGFLMPTTTSGANGSIQALTVQTDGRIVVGGFFTNFNSVVENRITRLNYDGSLDSTFNNNSGADNPVYALAQSPVDSKLLVGGSFATLGGVSFNGIARLNKDGTPDTSFNTGGLGAGSSGASSTVYAVAVQSNGQILIGGDFTTYNGVTVNHLARLNTDGSLDTNFTAAAGVGASDSIRAIAIQLDGKILLGGLFTSYNGVALNFIARLNPNGSVDSSFTPGLGANDMVSSIALQADGRIVLGGQFTQCNGVTRNRLTRLNLNGTVDPTINFGGGANDLVSAVVMQQGTLQGYPTNVTDEKIIIGGSFTQYNGQPQAHLARIFGGSQSGSGAFEFSSAQYQIDETGVNAFITVVRTGGTSGTNSDGSGDIYVPFATSNGSAVAGVNYRSVVINLDFAAGEVQQIVQIPVMDDGVITSNLTVNLAVNPLPPAQYGNQPVAVLTILNDDSAINFSTANYQVPKNIVNGVATINILRQGSSSGTASVIFNTTTNGSALAGTDYTPVTNALVVFNPGVTNVAVTIPIINNSLPEGYQTVTMQLTNVVNSTIYAPSNSTLTIIDTANVPGALSFLNSSQTVSEAGTNAYITIVRSNGVSGTVSVSYMTVAGTAVPGVNYITTSNTITFAAGVTTGTITVPLVSNNLVQGPVMFSVILANPTGGAILAAPTNITVTILDSNSGFAFVNATNYFRETNGSVAVLVQRIGGTSGNASVNYSTLPGTAVNGVNYTSVAGTLNFSAGQNLQSISLPLLYDPQVTSNLNFTLQLSGPVNAVLSIPSNSVIVLQDAAAGLSFTNAAMNVFKNAGSALITVVCSNPSVEPVASSNTIPLSVHYATANGTALSGIHYTAVSGTLVFTNGIGTNTFTVPILNNGIIDGNHYFSVNLSNPTPPGQLVAPSTQIVTIVDANAGFSFSSPTYTVLKSAASASITVLRTGNTNTAATVNFSATNGTAVAGTDFVATNGILSFTNGQVSQSFMVPVIASSTAQPDKTVLLQLFSPTNAILAAPNAATLTIRDNSGSLVVPAGSAFAPGGDPNNNGIIDPGETVTLQFAFRASAGTNINNLNATLLATNGVASPSPASQNYTPLIVGGPSASQPFTFTAVGTNSQVITPTFQLKNGSASIGTATFTYTLGSWTTTFANTNVIIINDYAPASPYPSALNVSGVGGTLIKATVTFTNLSHTSPSDIDALVVSPNQQDTLVMAHAGAQNAISHVTLTFDDTVTNRLPQYGKIISGTNQPTAFVPVPNFP